MPRDGRTPTFSLNYCLSLSSQHHALSRSNIVCDIFIGRDTGVRLGTTYSLIVYEPDVVYS